jgi:hypothetical protein
MIEAARREGAIHPDVTPERHRPRHHPVLPTPCNRLDPEAERAITHRQLATYLDGLIRRAR